MVFVRKLSRRVPEFVVDTFHGDCSNEPSTTLGKRFASPRKKEPRAKRMRERGERRELSRSLTPSHNGETSAL